jgi:hypothetical protein
VKKSSVASSLHARTLSELRANPAAKDVIESNQAAASEQRQKAEEKEYLGVFPDLTKSAERATQEERDQMVKDKELYYKLQNLEDHPGESGPSSQANHASC